MTGTQPPADSEPRLLLVVADDAAASVARNRGIVDACRRGVVRAVSVLATGVALDDLVARLHDLPRDRVPAIGLHFNLTEGVAAAGPAAGLTDGDGRFCGDKRAFWARALAGGVDPAAVQREATAQLTRLSAHGLDVTRADGHQHVHLLPGVRDGLSLALDDRSDVRSVRLGRPMTCAADRGFPVLPRDRVASEWVAVHDTGAHAAAAFGTLAREAKQTLGRGRSTAEVFVGLDLIGVLDTENLLRALRQVVRDGARTAELMTHPGECTGGATLPFGAQPARERERDALCDPNITQRLRELGFTLAAAGDIV